jgi:hypothetical protein
MAVPSAPPALPIPPADDDETWQVDVHMHKNEQKCFEIETVWSNQRLQQKTRVDINMKVRRQEMSMLVKKCSADS